MGYTVSADASLLNLGAADSSAGLQGIVNAYKSGNSSHNLQRDALQKSLIDKQNLSEQATYAEINSLPGTPHTTLDQNIQNFFMNEFDYAYDIKTLVKNGQMGDREGNALVGKLNADMDTYSTLAPQIMAQAEIMKAAIADGSISRANANEMQMMFMGIANNAGDIKLEKDENGNMFLSGTGNIDGESWEGKVNIKEIQQYLSTDGNQIARTIPTSEDMGFKDIFDTMKATGQFDQYMEPGYEQKIVDRRVMRQPSMKFTTKGLGELRAHLMQNPGLFEGLMKSEEGVAAWADVANKNLSAEQLNGEITEEFIPDPNCAEGAVCDDIKNPLFGKKDWGNWDVNDEEKRDFMKGKLIDRMLAENLDKEVLGKLELDKFELERRKAANARLLQKSNLSAGAKKSASLLSFANEAFKTSDLGALNNIKPGLEFVEDKTTGNWTAIKTKIEDGKKVLTEVKLGKINFKNKNSYLDVLNVLEITPNIHALNRAGFVAFDGSSLDVEQLVGARSEIVEYGNKLGGDLGKKGLGFKIDKAKDEGKSVEELLKIEGIGNKENISLTTLLKNNGVTISTWGVGNKKKIKIKDGSDIFNTKLNGLELTMENLDKILHFIDQGDIAQRRADDDVIDMERDDSHAILIAKALAEKRKKKGK